MPATYLLEEGVLVAVRRRAAAEEAQPLLPGGDLVPRAGRDQDRVARGDGAAVAVQLHLTRAFDEVVDLLGFRVVVALRRLAGVERRLGEALVPDRRGGEAEQLADRAPVRGRERLGLCERANDHAARLLDGDDRDLLLRRRRGLRRSPRLVRPRGEA